MIAFLVFAVLIVAVLYPNLFIFVGSFLPAGVFSVEHYQRFFSSPVGKEALANSVFISVITVLLSAAIGIPLAFALHRYEFRGRRFLRALAAAPVLLPPLVGVIAFYFLYGESGIISRSIQMIFGLSEPWPQLRGVSAILFVHAYSMYVYFFMFTTAGLERLDGAMEEAAESLGATSIGKLRRVVLPLLIPSFVGAALVTFMSSMASFSAPYIFGDVRVLSVEIFNAKLNGNIPLARVQTVLLASSSLAVLFLLRWYEGRFNYGLTGKGVSVRRKPIGSGLAKTVAAAGGAAAVGFLILPHVMVLGLSFVKEGTWTTQFLPPEYTTENYIRLFRDPAFFEPIRNSLWMAGAATAANLVWGLFATFWLRRQTGAIRRIADVLIVLPWALPGTVVAIAMLESFAQLMAGTIVLLPFLYFVRNIPLVYRALDASFAQIDPRIEEAAFTLGATPAYTIRRVILPLVLPGAIAGSLLAFIAALGEFVSSIMVYVYANRPISIEILSQLRQFNFGAACAYGVLLIILIAISLLVGERLRGPAKESLIQ